MDTANILKLSLTLTEEISTLLTEISQLRFDIAAKDEIIRQLKLQDEPNTNRTREYASRPNNRILSNEDVSTIKSMLNKGIGIGAIAEQFNVNTGVIVGINRNLTYCEIQTWEQIKAERQVNGMI